MQHIVIISAFLLVWESLLSFSVPGGTEKDNELCLLGGDKYLGWHYVLLVGPSKQLQLRIVMGTTVKFTVDNKDKVTMFLTSF